MLINFNYISQQFTKSGRTQNLASICQNPNNKTQANFQNKSQEQKKKISVVNFALNQIHLSAVKYIRKHN